MSSVFTLEYPMAPLWLAFPEYHRYSMGWRMGMGESYADDFWQWYLALPPEQQAEFQQRYPAPPMWKGIYNDDEDQCDDIVENPFGIQFWTPSGQPAYGLPQLCDDYRQKNKIDFLFFWGHKPAADGQISKSCFSQWWQSSFSLDVYTYCCMEQYMMAEKAMLFEDDDIHQQIMACQDPRQIKQLGRKVKNFDEQRWNQYKYTIVLEGNYYKFSQNSALRQFLLHSQDRILVEASPMDRIWGIGMSESNPDATNPINWRGQNLLGFALTEVRQQLKQVYRYYDHINWSELKQRYNINHDVVA